MRPVDLNFRPRSFSIPGLALLVAGGLVALAAGVDYGRTADRVGKRQDELARLQQAPRQRPAARGGEDRDTQQAMQAAAAVAQDIRRPWETLFGTLEAAKTDGVALLALNPDATKGTVRIAGEAKRREAILDFIQRLEKGGVLKNVFLVEDQLQQLDTERPYRFLLAADWIGAASP